MNKNFTDEQIKAYAKQFREDDAIWCNNRWQKVVKGADGGLVVNPNDNHYLINNGEDFGFNARLLGFSGVNKNPFRVTALRGYELQGGEKIVWLGESDSRRQFGECFNVFRYSNSFIYKNKVGYTFLVSGDTWGIIPSYKQVSEEKHSPKEENYEKDLMQLLERKYEAVEKKQNELKIESEKLKNKLEEIKLELDEIASSKTKIAMVMDLFKEDLKLENDKIITVENDNPISVYVGDQLMMDVRPINIKFKSE